MDLRMNRPSYDEYEEVESPYAPKSTETATRDKLRTRKNVFNRPFATEATSAPLVVETKSTRRSIGHPDMTEMLDHRQGEVAETEIEYMDEEEYEVEVEKKPAPRSSSKKSAKAKKNILPKIAWSVIGLLVLRLICMDRGVWDYFATEGDIKEKKSELSAIHAENKSLKIEISRIQQDKSYQRLLAKDHLGVIAADEFLILFAGETNETEDEMPDNQL